MSCTVYHSHQVLNFKSQCLRVCDSAQLPGSLGRNDAYQDKYQLLHEYLPSKADGGTAESDATEVRRQTCGDEVAEEVERE